MVLDVYHQSKDKGAAVIVHTPNGGRNQQWDFTPEGFLVSRDSGHVLEVPGRQTKDWVELRVWEKKPATTADALNQLWTWDEYGFIATKLNPNFVLDLPERTDKNGKPIIIHARHPF